MATFGVNNHHQSIVVNFIRFARYQRAQNLKSIEGSFRDVIDSRLLEDTYTSEEVREMLTGLCQVVRADVESELITSTHTNVILLKQLFSQAEKWHLNLQPDLSELENREQLDTVKSLEDTAFNTPKSDITLPQSIKLAPLFEGLGPTNLLNQEIDRLKEENNSLSTKYEKARSQVDGLWHEITCLAKKLHLAKQEIASLTENSVKSSALAEVEHLNNFEKKLVDVQEMLESNLSVSVSNQEALREDLLTAEKQLKMVKSKLQLAEQELERKFSETAAYTNMLKMLGKKNEMIKYLRGVIKKYEPEDLGDVLEID